MTANPNINPTPNAIKIEYTGERYVYAITPAITFLGISLGGMIAGAPMTEYVFGWPGLGRQYVASTLGLDFPTVMGITMIITVMTLIANLIMDILYVYIDPRVRIR